MFVDLNCGFFGLLIFSCLLYLLWKVMSSFERRRIDRACKKQCEREEKEMWEKYNRIMEDENRRNAEKNIGNLQSEGA